MASTPTRGPVPKLRRVRVVILNWNGGDRLAAAVASVLDAGWSRGDLDLVVVDNASTDGSLEVVLERFGAAVRVIRNHANTGFGANNLAMADLEGIDAVALVNPDAVVEPGWLEPLVAALEADGGLGAACPLMVFGPRFARVAVQSPTFRPGGGDDRELGVRLEGVRSAGVATGDPLGGVLPGDGVFDLEHGRNGPYRWLGGVAELLVPLHGPATASGSRPTVELELAAPTPVSVRVLSGTSASEVEVGPEARWVTVEVLEAPVDVVQNAGSLVFADGAGADRNWGRERGLATGTQSEVFAWCGGAVLLRRAYLEDVGLLHEPFFLYYEDTDLSWRGQANGWRYRFVPESVVRHDHAGSSGTSSARFAHYNERNRLLMLFRNAPMPLVRREVIRHLVETLRMAWRDSVGPLRRSRPPRPVVAWRRMRAFVAFLALVPTELPERRRLRGSQRLDDASLLARLTPR